MDKWEDIEDVCPICNNKMQSLADGTYQLAERCETCRIVIYFDNLDEEIKAEKY